MIKSYDIPTIDAVEDTGDFDKFEWLGFNYCKTTKQRADKCVHFYLDDYQFERVYNSPYRYGDMLSEFKYVLSPDFSLYTDQPVDVQIFNHYKKHWCAAFWQEWFEMCVIPTICWGDERSYDFCFEGEPTESVVSVSSVGVCNNKKTIELFHKGFMEMKKRLKPTKILFFGKPIEDSPEIIHMGEDDRLLRLRRR